MRHWRRMAVAALVAAVVGVAIYRSGAWKSPSRSFERTRQEALASAAGEYSRVRMVPLEDVGDSVARFLDACEIRGSSGEPGATADLLKRATEEFVRRRLVEDDFESYVRWRLSLGYRFRPVDEMQRMWQVREDHSVLLEKPPAEAMTSEEYMRALWPLGLGRGEGVNQPVALAGDPLGFTGEVAVVRDPADVCQILSGELGTDRWHGPMVGTIRRWMDPPNSPADLIKRHGTITVGSIGIIVELRSGERNPYLFSSFYDPELRRWQVHEVGRSHFSDLKFTSALEF